MFVSMAAYMFIITPYGSKAYEHLVTIIKKMHTYITHESKEVIREL